MEPADNTMTRVLPVDGALVGDMLLRFRRDADSSMVRWTLGDKGAAEVDVNFTSDGSRYSTAGRLWDRTGLALVNVAMSLEVSTPDTVELRLVLPAERTAWWNARADQLDALCHAALDELAEELLYHAARAGVNAAS